MKHKIVIGVTGGIGCGKSTVANYFKKKGAALLDADNIAHDCLKKGTPTYEKITQAFGEGILDKKRQIDKKKLSGIVFSNRFALRKLTQIVHPAVIEHIKEKIERSPRKVIVIDAPLLIETGLTSEVNSLVVVKARSEDCLKRTVRKLKISQEEVIKRIKAQMPLKDKLYYADFVVNNDGGLDKVKKQVEKIWKELTGG